MHEIGVRGFSEATLTFYREPFFYQTWMFRSLSATLATLLLAGIVWIRSKQIRLRYAAVLQERARVAREMHDTLIQGCTSTSAFLEAYEVAAHNPSAGSSPGTFLEMAREQLATTIAEARAAVWDLRMERSTSQSLVSALQESMAKMRRPGTRIEFVQDHRHVQLSREQVFELAMISREGLNNAMKHADASVVTVKISTTDEHLCLLIADNGCGFNHAAAEHEVAGHFGITGMKERAARLQGVVEMSGGPGQGTKLTIIIPLL